MIIRTYEELIRIPTFIGRYEYLKLGDRIGKDTFGFDRYLNQLFYKSNEWLKVRDSIILRDNGHDLGIEDYEIVGKIIVHHMNPIAVDDLKLNTDFLLNPNYLICTSLTTHNAIHFGTADVLVPQFVVERSKNDTCPWRH